MESNKPVRVLLVDDDPLIHVIFKRVAAKISSNIELEGVLLPMVGLEKFQQFAPDVVFLDINMPQMSGWEFLDALKTDFAGCKIYMYSSSIDPADLQRATRYPMVRDYVVKPISAVQLAGLIN